MTPKTRLRELAARSGRLVELARVQSVTGQILNIKPVPRPVADSILRSMRRKLEKGGDRAAVRAALLGPVGPRMRRAGKDSLSKLKAQARPGHETDLWKPKVVDIDGRKSLLHYRVAHSEDALKNASGWSSDSYKDLNPEGTMRTHVVRPGGAISTSVRRVGALRFIGTSGARPAEGIYATPLDELLKNQREKTKAAMINSSFPSEREITQTHGGNLLKVRQHKRHKIIVDPHRRPEGDITYVRQR